MLISHPGSCRLTGEGTIDMGKHSVAAAASPRAQFRSVAPTLLACSGKAWSTIQPTEQDGQLDSAARAAPCQNDCRRIRSICVVLVIDDEQLSRMRIAARKTLCCCAKTERCSCAGTSCTLERLPYLRSSFPSIMLNAMSSENFKLAWS